MNCPVCDSNQESLKFAGLKDWEYETCSSIDFYQCGDCGLLFQKPLPSIDLISSFYPKNYRNYLPIGSGIFSQLKKIKFRDQAKKLSGVFGERSAKILEIGYGNGELLIAFQDLDYKNLYGCDFSDTAAKRLTEKGIQVKIANVEREIPFDEKFDIIILNNVIEHFLDPVAVMKNCHSKLKPDGQLILFTPNTKAIEFKIFGKYWAGLHIPRHIHLFNQANLELMAHNSGFFSIRFHADLDPAQWAISIQNSLQDTKLFHSPLKNGMSFYMVPLSLMFIPVTLLQRLMENSTGLMCIVRR